MRPLCLTTLSLFLISIHGLNDSCWKHALVYQIYPRSFKDSNGDGVGDLIGITSKLEHIRDTGAVVIWLSPIYSSPQQDFGYDISNFKNVHSEYGTLQDFRDLTTKADSLGIKVLMDFVPNHSSSEHDWFKMSVKRMKPYDDYYIWKDAKINNGSRYPPNNWLSVFGGSAWEWSPERNQYYFHQFAVGQPDLNFRNEYVRKEMEDVLNFWLDRGVNGFRIDAINHLYEDAEWKDEPRSQNDVPPDDYDYLNHIYSVDQPETYDVLRNWRNLLDIHAKSNNQDKDLVLTEAYTSIPMTMKYYSSGSNVPMNFAFITDVNKGSSASQLKSAVEKFLNVIPHAPRTSLCGFAPNWVTGNHDNHRMATRFGPKREDQMSALAMILPGLVIIYNGDEIGMVDRRFSFEETLDPAGRNAGPERYELKSRDPERTPFQWDDSVSAGFSSSDQTWLPVNENYKTLNLKAQKMATVSHFKAFLNLAKLRNTPILKDGSLEVKLVGEKVLAVIRRLDGYQSVVLLINASNDEVEINVSGPLKVPQKMIVSMASVHSGIPVGLEMDMIKLNMPGAATVVFGSGDIIDSINVT